MAVNLKGRSFLTLKDFTPAEIRYLLDLSHDLKAKKRAGILGDSLKGKNVVLLFEKTSTRTRCAFECGAAEEGAHVTFLTNSQMGKKESIEEHAHKPLSEIKLVFTGDTRNNMSYALMYGAAKMGMHFVALGPDSLKPDEDILKEMQEYSKETGATIEFCSNVDEAVKDADVIYTDIWVSMGEDESLYPERVKLLTPYKVTREMMNKTGNKNTLFMHCLPSFHDEDTEVCKDMMDRLGLDIREVEDEVFRSKNSVVFDEAENRMHTIKAVMVATAGR